MYRVILLVLLCVVFHTSLARKYHSTFSFNACSEDICGNFNLLGVQLGVQYQTQTDFTNSVTKDVFRLDNSTLPYTSMVQIRVNQVGTAVPLILGRGNQKQF